jgi:3D-(3,5/4)-trihydroxycyclohexane-1,2-dione acylhydrolase (decyclizing)
VPHDHPLYGGALGIIGAASANNLAAAADVVVAVGTRLQDFTTASWTAFAQGVRIVTVNAARFDAVKHNAIAVVGDARETLSELSPALGNWASGDDWAARAAEEKATWDAQIDSLRSGGHSPDGSLTYAQVTGVVNDLSDPTTTCSPPPAACPASCTAAGGPARSSRPGRPRARRWTSSTASPAWATRSSRRGARRWPVRDPPDGWSRRSSATART